MKRKWHKAYLGVGSNLGDRKRNINRCIGLLEENKQIKLKKKASFFRTKPVGGPAQRDYINSVFLIETTLLPWNLLKCLKEIENKLGRKKTL